MRRARRAPPAQPPPGQPLDLQPHRAPVRPQGLHHAHRHGLHHRVGRVVVEPDLSLKNHPEVFVLGDQACSVDQKTGEPLPGLAPVAIQQGRHTGRNIRRRLDGQETLPFKYFDKGIMATIGRMKAIVETKHMKLTGSFAWYAWLFVHIYYLIGFRNKVFVLLQWATSYLRFKKGARLIAEKSWRAYDD